MNPPFLKLTACWMSILDPQLHVDGMVVNLQPQRNRRSPKIVVVTFDQR